MSARLPLADQLTCSAVFGPPTGCSPFFPGWQLLPGASLLRIHPFPAKSFALGRGRVLPVFSVTQLSLQSFALGRSEWPSGSSRALGMGRWHERFEQVPKGPRDGCETPLVEVPARARGWRRGQAREPAENRKLLGLELKPPFVARNLLLQHPDERVDVRWGHPSARLRDVDQPIGSPARRECDQSHDRNRQETVRALELLHDSDVVDGSQQRETDCHERGPRRRQAGLCRGLPAKGHDGGKDRALPRPTLSGTHRAGQRLVPRGEVEQLAPPWQPP
jgi:hypothetical protein